MGERNIKNKPEIKIKPAAVMYIATCLLWFSLYFYMPILSTYCEKMGASYTLVGTILSSYGLVQLIMRLPVGIWSDITRKRKAFLLLGMASAAVSGAGFFFASGPSLLLLFRALAGVTASTWAIYMLTYCGYYPASEQSKGMGIIGTSMFLGQVIATFIAGILTMYIDERWTFLISSLAAVLGVIMLTVLPEPELEQREVPKVREFVSMLKNRDLIFFSLMAIILQIATFAGPFGFVPNLLHNMGANNFHLGLSATFATLFAILTSFYSGSFFEEKVGIRRSVIISYIVTALALAGMAFAAGIWQVLLLVLACGAPRGLLQPMLNSLAIRGIKPQIRSSAASMFQSIYGLGMMIGPIIAGAIADAFGITAAFFAIGTLTLSGAVMMTFKKKLPGWIEQ